MAEPVMPSMQLLPPGPGMCPACGIKHEPDFPHDATSMYYQMRFQGLRGRWPSWADALAHCTEHMKQHWEQGLRKLGKWTEPPDGQEPIADPPGETINQLVNMEEHRE